MSQRPTVTLLLDALGQPRALSQPAFLLKVVKGPDKRRQLKVDTDRVRIGGGGADLTLEDPTVSAVHCEILADVSGFRVRDLGSRNGTWLRERRLVEAWLEDGDDLVLGNSVVRFKLLEEKGERALSARKGMGRLIGGSPPMRALYAQLERLAATDATVLIQGETGTGKDLAAEAIVAAGDRRDRPVVVVDCAALAPSLAESELFGHEEGAFTGAVRSAAGAFERANGGTLFLDEIGELPLALQPRLLGALERRRIRRLGGSKDIELDVRVIAATHVELEREVNRGRFRADLFYRLAVAQVRMPSLREHLDDVPELVAHFLSELGPSAPLPPDVLTRLYEGDYPGNVRELRNAVERAVVGLPLDAAGGGGAGGGAGVGGLRGSDLDQPFRVLKERIIADFERSYVTRLLEQTGGNVSEAARRAQIDRMNLHKLLRRLGIRAH